jgi:hypothetical protein
LSSEILWSVQFLLSQRALLFPASENNWMIDTVCASTTTPLLTKLLVMLAISTVVTACTTARMNVDPGLEGRSDVYNVKGLNYRWLNDDIQMGPWLVTRVREGWQFSWGLEIDDVELMTAVKPVRFQVVDKELGAVQVECRQRSIEAGWRGVVVDVSDIAHPRMRCGLQTPGGRHQLVLAMSGQEFAGEVRGTVFDIKSEHRLAGATFANMTPVGFVINQGSRQAAAVELINDGRFWIQRDLPPETRMLLAAVSAALMFFQPEMI